jgi:hypothetical protein
MRATGSSLSFVRQDRLHVEAFAVERRQSALRVDQRLVEVIRSIEAKDRAQVAGFTIVFLSSVTAPTRASALPTMAVPVAILIDLWTSRLP